MNSHDRQSWRSALDAALILAIGMGFGRFAYTALYPYMVQDGLLSLGQGSLAASANYAGYLLGALLAIRIRAHHAARLCLWTGGATALSLMILAVLHTPWLIIAVRGIAGALSALALIAASLWLLEHRRHAHGAPLMFAGVGLGIALSAELVVAGAWFGLHSQGLWLLLGLASLALALLALPGLKVPAEPSTDQQATPDSGVLARRRPLVAIYGLAGFGYIITATYLPLLVKSALPDLDPAHVWAVFGAGAAPSCFIWHRLHLRWGTHKALALNLAVQALGVILPVLAPMGAGYLLSALLVGATFMGTVTIAMPAAQRIARAAGGNLVASMTGIYSLGQIAGPLLANAIHTLSQSFAGSLWVAGAALAAGSMLCFTAL